MMVRSAAIAALALALAGAGRAEDKETKEIKVKMRDLPAAVRQAVQEQTRGASLRGLSKEVENGKTYYEAALKVGRHAKDVLLDESGAVVEVEEEVPLSALPPAAREAVQKASAGGKLVKLEAITKNNILSAYEAAIKKSGKTSEIKVTPGGKPVEQ
jgi:hypothetical protein